MSVNKVTKKMIYLFTSFLRGSVMVFLYTAWCPLADLLWVTFLQFYDANSYKHNIKYLWLIFAASKNMQRRRSRTKTSTWPSHWIHHDCLCGLTAAHRARSSLAGASFPASGPTVSLLDPVTCVLYRNPVSAGPQPSFMPIWLVIAFTKSH